MKEITVSDNFAKVIEKLEEQDIASEVEVTNLLLTLLQQKEKETKIIRDNIAEINKRLEELKKLGCTFVFLLDKEPIADDLVVLYNDCKDMGTLDLLP